MPVIISAGQRRSRAKKPLKFCLSTIKRLNRAGRLDNASVLRTVANRRHVSSVTRGPGDIVVTGVITRYSRKGLSFGIQTLPRRRITALTLPRMSPLACATRARVLLDKDVNGYAIIQVGGDLTDTERQSLPLLAEDLARNVAELLTEGTW